jgi:hypothetical protein
VNDRQIDRAWRLALASDCRGYVIIRREQEREERTGKRGESGVLSAELTLRRLLSLGLNAVGVLLRKVSALCNNVLWVLLLVVGPVLSGLFRRVRHLRLVGPACGGTEHKQTTVAARVELTELSQLMDLNDDGLPRQARDLRK